MKKEYKEITSEEDILIRYIQDSDKKLSDKSINAEWQRIANAIELKKPKPQQKNHQRLYVRYSSVAAILIAVLFTGYFAFNPPVKSMGIEQYQSIASNFQSVDETNEITLINNGEKILSPKKVAEITYSANGVASIDDRNLNSHTTVSNGSISDKFNCVIVPKGKQSCLTFSDGTKLHVNSRSKIVYPKEFAANIREIYVEGEAFLEVSHNAKKPFIVKTLNFDIKVLGTKFNVTAYKEKQHSVVTLVEGSVAISDRHDNTAKLKPSESISISKEKLGKPTQVDTNQFIDWVHGYFMFNETPLKEVLKKLSFHYNVNIEMNDNVNDLSLTGKLDIQTDLKDAMNNLSNIVGVQILQNNDKIIVSKVQSDTNSN